MKEKAKYPEGTRVLKEIFEIGSMNNPAGWFEDLIVEFGLEPSTPVAVKYIDATDPQQKQYEVLIYKRRGKWVAAHWIPKAGPLSNKSAWNNKTSSWAGHIALYVLTILKQRGQL